MRIPVVYPLDARNEDSYPWADRNGSGILNGYVRKNGDRYFVEKRVGANPALSAPWLASGDRLLGGINKIFSGGSYTPYYAFHDATDNFAYLYSSSNLGALSSALYSDNLGIPIHFTDCDGYLVANNWRIGETYTYNGATLARITDADYSASVCAGGAYLNGRFFMGVRSGVATAGDIVQSDLNNPTSYDPLNSLNAERKPDGINLIFEQSSHIVAVGDASIEVFYDNQNASGSVLKRREDIYYNLGIAPVTNYYRAYASAYTRLGGDVFFIAASSVSGSGASPSVYKMTNLQIEKISSPSVDTILAEKAVSYNEQMWLGNANDAFGKKFFFLTYVSSIVTPEFTLVYDIEEGVWYQWAYAATAAFPVVLSVYSGSQNVIGMLSSSGTPTIHNVNRSLTGGYKDNNANFTFGIRTRPEDFGTRKRKFCSEIAIIGDLIADATEDDFTISWSDDDYQTWSAGRTVSMDKYRKITRCGSFRRRAFEIEHALDSPYRIEALEIEAKVGDS